MHEKFVEVLYTWDRKYGLKKGPKRSSERQIPIPSKTSAALAELMSLSPFDEPMDLVFFGRDRHTPLHNEPILKNLYRAFENIGILPEEREKTKRDLSQLALFL